MEVSHYVHAVLPLKGRVGAGNGEKSHCSPAHPAQPKPLAVRCLPRCVQPVLGVPLEACLGFVAQRWRGAPPWDMTCKQGCVRVAGG